MTEFGRGHKSTALVMPTGTGKTIVFAMVGDSRDWGRVLVLAGRQELIDQAADKIYKVTGDKPDIDMAQQWAPMLDRDLFASGKFVVGSIQTVSKAKRLSRYNWKDFGLIIIDEGHHAVASTYQSVIRAARAENPLIKVLLVSATFDRADGKKMGGVCDSIAYKYEINQAVDDGWLVPVRQQFVRITGLDFSHIRTKGGDLDPDELAAVISDDGGETIHKIASATVQAAGRSGTVVFTPSVASAHRIAEVINRDPSRCGEAVALDGKVEKDKRRAILSAYERGEFQYLVNCNLVVEGWDSQRASVLVMARPTKSRALYAQAAGRVLRPLAGVVDNPLLGTPELRRGAIAASGKPSALIVDLVGNSGRHKLVCSADLLGNGYEQAVVDSAKKRLASRKTPADTAQILEEEKARLEKKRADAERRRTIRKEKVYGKVSVQAEQIDPFGASAVPTGLDVSEVAGAERGASGAQQEYLLKIGLDPRGMSFAEAQRLIAESFARRKDGLCSRRVANILESYGYPGLRMKEDRARAVLDLVKANGSKPRAPIQREQLSLKPYGSGKYRLVARVDGKKIVVGPAMPIDKAREYGKLLLG